MSALVLYSAAASEPLSVAEVKAHLRLDGTNAEPAPSAVTVALAGAGAGNVDNGVHRWLATFVTASGETEAGAVSGAVTVVDKTLDGKVAVSAIPLGGAAVTARKLYRTQANGSSYLYHSTIADNTTTSVTDNTADSALGAGAPSANTTDDPLLVSLIEAARYAAEMHTNRALVTQTWDLYLDAFPGWEIYVPKPKLQSVSAITYVDSDGATQTLDASQYLVDSQSEPARITPQFGLIWPVTRWQTNAVKVRFVAGYGAAAAVPQGIKNWMLRRISTLWDNRDDIVVDARITMVELPEEFVDGLLDPYRVEHFCWAS